ncbi:hypothetical protein L1887_20712 [Cichorium endivia]|nr:hypothetical protein L1887_20712 [Cichorium endivia]
MTIKYEKYVKSIRSCHVTYDTTRSISERGRSTYIFCGVFTVSPLPLGYDRSAVLFRPSVSVAQSDDSNPSSVIDLKPFPTPAIDLNLPPPAEST